MECKTFEVRDRATFIPVLAVRLTPGCEADRYLFARSDYGRTPEDQGYYVLVAPLADGNGKATSDPYGWAGRTMTTAHEHIRKFWSDLPSGAVIDVEYILNETARPKRSEAAK